MITGNEPATGYGFCTADGQSHVDEKGLTIRQYYAGLAMQGICSQQNGEYTESQYTVNGGWLHPETVAKAAVELADALINELNKDK